MSHRKNRSRKKCSGRHLQISSKALTISNLTIEDERLCRILITMPEEGRLKFITQSLKAGALSAEEEGTVTKISEIQGPAIVLQVTQRKSRSPPGFYS